MLTVGTALPALFLIVLGLTSSLVDTPLELVLPLGMGISIGSLSYWFGRFTLAVWSEKKKSGRISEPGWWPFAVCFLAMIAALASIPFLDS